MKKSILILFVMAITTTYAQKYQPTWESINSRPTPAWFEDIKFGWKYLVQRSGLFWMLWYFALVNFLLNVSNVLSTPLILSFGTATDL